MAVEYPIPGKPHIYIYICRYQPDLEPQKYGMGWMDRRQFLRKSTWNWWEQQEKTLECGHDFSTFRRKPSSPAESQMLRQKALIYVHSFPFYIGSTLTMSMVSRGPFGLSNVIACTSFKAFSKNTNLTHSSGQSRMFPKTETNKET